MLQQDDIRHFRTLERRHMMRVKDALAAGLERLQRGAASDPDFIVGCVDYLEFIMRRFFRQGEGNAARLQRVIAGDDAGSQAILDDIVATLAAARRHLERLVAARDSLGPDGQGIDALAAAGREFLEFYNGTLARRKDPAQAIVERYFDPETYWRATDDVTPESIESERALFQRLTDSAPDIIQPDSD